MTTSYKTKWFHNFLYEEHTTNISNKKIRKKLLNELTQRNLELESFEQHDCSICMSKITKINYTKTKCGHTYHKKCLRIWFTKNSTCPMCRQCISCGDPDCKGSIKLPTDIVNSMMGDIFNSMMF